MGSILTYFYRRNKEDDVMKDNNISKNVNKISEEDTLILKLKVTQDKIVVQKKNMIRNSDKAYKEAKKLVEENRRERAYFALKVKKLYDEYLEQTEKQLALIQKTIIEFESAQITANMVQVLQQSNQLLKKLDFSNKLKDVIEDIQQTNQDQDTVAQILKENDICDASIENLFQQFEADVQYDQYKDLQSMPKKIKLEESKNEPFDIIINNNNAQTVDIIQDKIEIEDNNDDQQNDIGLQLQQLA